MKKIIASSFFLLLFLRIYTQKKIITPEQKLLFGLPPEIKLQISTRIIEPILNYLDATSFYKQFTINHTNCVPVAQVSPNENNIATTWQMPSAILWRIGDNPLAHQLDRHNQIVNKVQFSSNGHRVGTADNSIVNVWNLENYRLQQSFHASTKPIQVLRFHPQNHSVVVTGSGEGVAKLFTISDQEALLSAQYNENPSIFFNAAFNSRGNQLVTAAYIKRATIWDAEMVQPIRSLKPHDPISNISFTPNDNMVFSNNAFRSVQVWDIRQSSPVYITQQYNDTTIGHFQMHPNCLELSTTIGNKVHVWDMRINEKRKGRLIGHKNNILSLAYNRDGSKIVTASSDNTAKVWDTKLHCHVTTLIGHTGSVLKAQFFPKTSRILTNSTDGNVIVWDQNGIPKRILPWIKNNTTLTQAIALQNAFYLFSQKKTSNLSNDSQTYRELRLLPRLFYRLCTERLRIKILQSQESEPVIYIKNLFSGEQKK